MRNHKLRRKESIFLKEKMQDMAINAKSAKYGKITENLRLIEQ